MKKNIFECEPALFSLAVLFINTGWRPIINIVRRLARLNLVARVCIIKSLRQLYKWQTSARFVSLHVYASFDMFVIKQDAKTSCQTPVNKQHHNPIKDQPERWGGRSNRFISLSLFLCFISFSRIHTHPVQRNSKRVRKPKPYENTFLFVSHDSSVQSQTTEKMHRVQRTSKL